jgi:hypothetical protein
LDAGRAGFFGAVVVAGIVDVCAHPAGASASPIHTAPVRLSLDVALRFIPIY